MYTVRQPRVRSALRSADGPIAANAQLILGPRVSIEFTIGLFKAPPEQFWVFDTNVGLALSDLAEVTLEITDARSFSEIVLFINGEVFFRALRTDADIDGDAARFTLVRH